ncbi:MAG: hypothetical protein HY842_15535 [Bacteroidetes bacterium]|nr:hypothetical protein [Bacteroidota bacterium]
MRQPFRQQSTVFADEEEQFFSQPEIYIVTAGILISDLRVRLYGVGRYATMITFNPSYDYQTLFRFDRGAAGVSWQCAIRDMALVSSEDTGLTKTAIELKDTSNMMVKDLIIGPWTGKGNSIGLLVRGREAGHINNLHIRADRPLVIDKNDQNPDNDIDHFNFSDLYLLVTQGVSQPCIFIADGLDLQHVTFGGFQAWVAGTFGLYWHDTTTTAVSFALSISNVRTEQLTGAGHYSIYIHRNALLDSLLIENMMADRFQNGFYFRRIQRVTLRHVTHGSDQHIGIKIEDPNPEQVVNDAQVIDGVEELVLDQVSIGSGEAPIVEMPTMVEKIGFNRLNSNSKVSDTAYYARIKPSAMGSHAMRFFGETKVWSHSGTLGNGEELNLPAANNFGRKVSMVWVAASGSNGSVTEGGQAMDAANSAVRLSGTTNFDVVNFDPINPIPVEVGKLAVFHDANTTVINKLGQPVDLVVFVTWT